MQKLFVDVNTPGNGKNYEFQLDALMTVGQAKEKMIDEITEIESGNITLNPEKVMLFNLNTHIQLLEADTFRAAGVKSGQKLLLC